MSFRTHNLNKVLLQVIQFMSAALYILISRLKVNVYGEQNVSECYAVAVCGAWRL